MDDNLFEFNECNNMVKRLDHDQNCNDHYNKVNSMVSFFCFEWSLEKFNENFTKFFE